MQQMGCSGSVERGRRRSEEDSLNNLQHDQETAVNRRHLQIREISTSTHNLNMTLKAYSDGLFFGKDSMVISHELLKRARNLEKSLKVLGDLQQESQLMKMKTHPPLEAEQSVSRVSKLKFSLNGVLRFIMKNRKGSKYEKKQTVSSQELKEQMSSEQEDSSGRISSSKEHENPRISNVNSKLMGLEEISSLKIEPPKSDDDYTQQTDHVSRQENTRERESSSAKINLKEQLHEIGTMKSLAKKKVQALKSPSAEENKVKTLVTLQSPRDTEEELLHSVNLRRQEKLPDDESHLMNIVIGNEELLNTIQVAFKLRIHVSIIERDTILEVDDEDKLILDCALELMRRKLKIQEFEHTVQFFNRRRRSLLSVVKDLNNEMKAMVGADATWDVGWDSNIFGMNTVIMGDVQEIILNSLIEEMVRGFR